MQAIPIGAKRRSVPVESVCDNGDETVREFFQPFGWTSPIRVLSFGTPSVSLMVKLNPFLAEEVASALGVDVVDCVFVGDSPTDVEAGIAAGRALSDWRKLWSGALSCPTRERSPSSNISANSAQIACFYCKTFTVEA